MKNGNPIITVLKFIGMLILSLLLWALIASVIGMTDDYGNIQEPFPGFIFIMAVLTVLVFQCGFQYNAARRFEQGIRSSASDIRIIKKRNESLLDKANRFVDKHRDLEKQSILEIRESSKKTVHNKEIVTPVANAEVERHETTLQKESHAYQAHPKLGSKTKRDDKADNLQERSVSEKRLSKNSTVIESSEEFGDFLNQMPELLANKNVERLFNEIFETENSLAQFRLQYNQDVERYNTIIHQLPLGLFAKRVGLTPLSYYEELENFSDITDDMLGL